MSNSIPLLIINLPLLKTPIHTAIDSRKLELVFAT
jgi:hypothetical protein